MEQLAPALAALLLAIAALVREEVRDRRARRERDALGARLTDVQRRVGADRRASDDVAHSDASSHEPPVSES